MIKKIVIITFLIACSWTFGQEVTPSILKKIKASEFKLDENNGDGVFVAKNKKTKKWGMFQAWSENDIKEMIPMSYDSIDFFGFNNPLTGVWNNGKVGIFTSTWRFGEEDAKQTVPCFYEDYKIFNVEKNIVDDIGRYRKDIIYLAVKKDGLWAWIDWLTGELKTAFIYDLDKEQMPYPEFEQQN